MFVLLLCTNTAAVKEPKIIEKRAIVEKVLSA